MAPINVSFFVFRVVFRVSCFDFGLEMCVSNCVSFSCFDLRFKFRVSVCDSIVVCRCLFDSRVFKSCFKSCFNLCVDLCFKLCFDSCFNLLSKRWFKTVFRIVSHSARDRDNGAKAKGKDNGVKARASKAKVRTEAKERAKESMASMIKIGDNMIGLNSRLRPSSPSTNLFYSNKY